MPFPMNDTRAVTVGERIVVHLSQYARVQDEYVVPPEMAQDGIATSLGISRAHAAIELKRAMIAGRVEMRIAHVTGAPTRRKVYRLTPRGAGVARTVRDRALRRTVEGLLPDGRWEVLPGPRALEALRRHGVAEARATLLLLTLDRIDVGRTGRLSPEAPVRFRAAEAGAGAAFEAAFVHPFAWHLDIVLGPPHAPPVKAAA